MEQWMVINKGADFKGIGNKFHIDPVTARIIRNREVIGDEEIHSFLAGTLQELPDVHLMQDLDLLVELLDQKINEKAKIRIIGDYDIDGVMSSYILYRALTRCGAPDHSPNQQTMAPAPENAGPARCRAPLSAAAAWRVRRFPV